MDKVKFAGLTVQGLQSRIDWGAQISELSLQLIADPIDGDSPTITSSDIGTPAYFTLGSLTFNGLLKQFTKEGSTSGNPVYKAKIVDPREILEGAVVITADYPNAVYTPNTLNAYGYLESFGFGTSEVNDAGVPWYKVKTAILAIANNTAGTYGGPLTFAGSYTYGLDLSGLPTMPNAYRVPAGHATILELISHICEDAGYDYYITLVSYTITIKCVQRITQPPLGTLSSIISDSITSGNVSRYEFGDEFRNETTSAMLVGGNIQSISATRSFSSYWGTDISGDPIIGTSGSYLSGTSIPMETFTLNSSAIADVIGSVTYPSNTVEMRCALGGQGVWESYIQTFGSSVIKALVASPTTTKGNPLSKCDILVDDKNQSGSLGNMSSQVFGGYELRIFQFVRGYANQFYGKNFLVEIPSIYVATDSDTGLIYYSLETADSGWVDGGAAALGAPSISVDILQTPDEKVVPFAYYSNSSGADIDRVDPSSSVVDPSDGSLWLKTTIDPSIIIVPGTIPVPAVHVKLSSVIYDQALDEFGAGDSTLLIDKMVGPNAKDNIKRAPSGGTVANLGIQPAARYPYAFGIPLKSNTLTYGPWYVVGAAGRTRYEQDQSLVPWSYGGTTSMNAAGTSRVVTSVTNTRVFETGNITRAEIPQFSLGDIMVSGGPNLTSINAEYTINGWSTTYRVETFQTPFGLLSRQNAERIGRNARGAVAQRALARKALAIQFQNSRAETAAFNGYKRLNDLFNKKASPNDVIMTDLVSDGSGHILPLASSEKSEAAYVLHADNSGGWANKGLASLTSIVRPYSTASGGSGSLMPYYTTPTSPSGINSTRLNAYASGNDIQVLSYGTGIGANQWYSGTSGSVRGLALRGPLEIAGWGYDLNTKPVPSNGSGGFLTNYLKRSDAWPVGPLDPLWDPTTGTWSVHDIRSVVPTSSIATGASGTAYISGTTYGISVYNSTGASLSSGSGILAAYISNKERFEPLGQGGTVASVSQSVVTNVCPTLGNPTAVYLSASQFSGYTPTDGQDVFVVPDVGNYDYVVGDMMALSGIVYSCISGYTETGA